MCLVSLAAKTVTRNKRGFSYAKQHKLCAKFKQTLSNTVPNTSSAACHKRFYTA
jgi:hypothetical protein